MYVALSGIVFGFVAVLHLLRSVFSWQAQIAEWVVPLWVSWGGLLIALALSLWGFLLWTRTGKKGTP
jgi:hypothetical protein